MKLYTYKQGRVNQTEARPSEAQNIRDWRWGAEAEEPPRDVGRAALGGRVQRGASPDILADDPGDALQEPR